MVQFKGIIALDIDGTLTTDKYSLPSQVRAFLQELIQEGEWKVVFVTGRTFAFTLPILAGIEGSFLLAVQNGAALYEMPNLRCINKSYLKGALIPQLTSFFQETAGGLLIESGKENGDICYYNPHDFSEGMKPYIAFRISISPEKWEEVFSFEALNLSEFAVGKFFGSLKEASQLEKVINQLGKDQFQTIVIKDPFNPGHYLGHINHPQATKAHMIEVCKTFFPGSYPIIAAGDDYNDAQMLEKSTCKIVMEQAPFELLARADIRAASPEKQGIIPALKEAIFRYGRDY